MDTVYQKLEQIQNKADKKISLFPQDTIEEMKCEQTEEIKTQTNDEKSKNELVTLQEISNNHTNSIIEAALFSQQSQLIRREPSFGINVSDRKSLRSSTIPLAMKLSFQDSDVVGEGSDSQSDNQNQRDSQNIILVQEEFIETFINPQIIEPLITKTIQGFDEEQFEKISFIQSEKSSRSEKMNLQYGLEYFSDGEVQSIGRQTIARRTFKYSVKKQQNQIDNFIEYGLDYFSEGDQVEDRKSMTKRYKQSIKLAENKRGGKLLRLLDIIIENDSSQRKIQHDEQNHQYGIEEQEHIILNKKQKRSALVSSKNVSKECIIKEDNSNMAEDRREEDQHKNKQKSDMQVESSEQEELNIERAFIGALKKRRSQSFDNLSYRLFQRDRQNSDLRNSRRHNPAQKEQEQQYKALPLIKQDKSMIQQFIEQLESSLTPSFQQMKSIRETFHFDDSIGFDEDMNQGTGQVQMPRHTTYSTNPVKLITQVDRKSPLQAFQSLTEHAKIQRIVQVGINWLVQLPPQKVFIACLKVQKFWKKMRGVLRRFRRRGFILKELYDTEKTYISNLEYMIKQQKYLRFNAQCQNPFLSSDQVKILFGNVQILKEFNSKFFKQIEKRMQNWDHDSLIGDVFIRFAPFFKLYHQYFQNYEKAEKIYEKAMKRPGFQAYNNELLKHPDSKFLSLNSFLIMPVQRPVKYPLLLKDLLMHTKVSHKDFKNIKKALEDMKEINVKVNTGLQKRISQLKKIDLQKQYGDKVNLLDPSRYLIGDQKLTLIESGSHSRDVEVILFNDKLLILNDQGNTYIGHIDFDSSSFIKNMNDLKYFQNVFTVTGGTKSYKFCAQTLTSKIEILEKLQSIIRNIRKNLEARQTAMRLSYFTEVPSHSSKSMMIPARSATNLLETEPAFSSTSTINIQNPFLKETPLIIDIVGTEWRFTHTVYIIEITKGKQKTRIFKRYSEFDKLYKTLTHKWPSILLPKMPKKRWLTFKTKVVEERKILLEKFLQQIVLYKVFQNDSDLMHFLQIEDWAMEFNYDGQQSRQGSIFLSKWTHQQKTQDIQIHFCNRSTQIITVPVDTKAVQVQYYIAKQCGIQNFREWGLYIIEPHQDEKLIDSFDRPLDNMKKHNGMFESAMSKFSAKWKLYCSIEDQMANYLKVKGACFLFKRAIFDKKFFKTNDKLDQLHFKELDLLYSQCVAYIATNFIKLKTGDLIELSAYYLLFTYGIKSEAPPIIKEEILKLVSHRKRSSKVSGFWEDRIEERWETVSQQKIKGLGIFSSEDQQYSNAKRWFIRRLKSKNFFGSSFYWVEPYGSKGNEEKLLSPYFWLAINYQTIFLIQVSTYQVVRSFDIQNVSLQVFPSALIINAFNPSQLKGTVVRRTADYSLRVNTPRGFEIQNLLNQYQNELVSNEYRSKSVF